ncbi:uncharacterized protein DUF4167 [Litoreibacter meonggei]|uniref:Uncharacterized protein DUF4167 n=1 Tax=Litoreibacter meonggei TaxID=1049199 RepID=A0A497VH48_9RHOB|nr:DUF4167 domain-containing protein [Litoreibacter meonggei]RLJ41567.1 uncharacterized protein DUF4167 [Litoreibacter meonggei]
MRSTKSRSRGKNRNNNNRSGVNVVNRVFDSSGPEGKVRGTPQQIIEKYQQLHRDAQLSNDRVAAENFSQHAEHYARMLGEAMKEQEARREAHEAQQQAQREQQQKRDQNQSQNQNQNPNPNQNRDQPRQRSEERQPDVRVDDMSPAALAAAAEARAGGGSQSDVIDLSENSGDSGLVETVEAAPKPARKPRTRKPKAKPTDEGEAPKDETPAAE